MGINLAGTGRGTHQGHGPRADETGRIHISDFRYSRTNSLAISSRSIDRAAYRSQLDMLRTANFYSRTTIST